MLQLNNAMRIYKDGIATRCVFFLVLTIAVFLVAVLETSCLYHRTRESAFSYVQFLGSTGWICGDQCFSSTNDGEDWNLLTETIPGEYFPADGRWRFQFLTPNIGFHSLDGNLHRTLDRGKTWELLNKNESVAGFRFKDPTLGLSFGSDYKTFYTMDSGDHWQESLNFHLQAVAFDSKGQVFGAAGRSLLAAQSVTGPWNKFTDLTQAIWGLKINGHHLWLVGDFGLCVRYDTLTGDIADFSLPGRPERHLYDIGFWMDKKVVVGTRGSLFVSKIEDTAWQPASVPEQSLMSIAFNSKGEAFVVGGTATPVFVVDLVNPQRIVLRSDDLVHWHKISLVD